MSEDKDLSFDEAWDMAVDGNTTDSTDVSESHTDTSTDANNTNTDESSSSATVQDTTSTTQSDTDDGSATSQPSLEEAVAQAKLWEQRFRSFEGRVQAEMERRKAEELERQKQFVDALSNAKHAASTSSGGDSASKPSKFEELSKDFPEIADAVEEYLSNKLSKTEALVKQVIDERVAPLAEDAVKQRYQTHQERILSKHPDAIELKNSGALDAWIDTLPIYAKHGANYVVHHGSADEVLALLDQYKDYRNSKTNTNQNTDKPTMDSGTRSQSRVMVEAVKAGLAVKPGKSNDPKTETTSSTRDDFVSGWEDAIKKLGV